MNDKPYEHIMAIEFTKSVAGYEIPMVALFNNTVIDGVTVRKILTESSWSKLRDYEDRIVVIYKTQYDTLCGKIKGE